MFGLNRLRGVLGHARSANQSASTNEEPTEPGDVDCGAWRQGDVFDGAKAFAFDRIWNPQELPTEHGVAIVSQSCDASLRHRWTVLVAPVLHIEEGATRSEALSGKQTHLVPLPQLGEGYFADLEGITTVAKAALAPCARRPGVVTDQEVREFAFSVARRFGRFAYPDEVVRSLGPVKNAIQEKATRPASPLGQALKRVHSFRVACENWATTPYELTIIVVMEPAVFPTDLDELVEEPTLASSLGIGSEQPLKTQINACLAKLQQSTDAGERYYVWHHLVDLWARQCEEAAAAQGNGDIVGSVISEIVAVDEFPMSRYLASESLDLDYLSESKKLGA